MSEWKEMKLCEVGRVITGKTPSKNNPEEWGNKMLFITPSDYRFYGKRAVNSVRKLSDEGKNKFSEKVLPIDSILVTCIGSDMGKVVMNGLPAVTNQQINSIIPNADVVNPDFAYYLLVDLYEILRIYGADGTAVPIVNKGDFEKIEALIPPLNEQHTIASVLSSLDDKIDLLHRQNQTLEQMAETLFRQWFMEEESELISLGDCIQTTSGGTPSRKKMDYYKNGVYQWVKSKELNGGYILETEEEITEEALKNSSAKLLPENSILIAMYGATVGQFAIIGQEATCNQAICACLPNEKFPYTFIYHTIKANVDELKSRAVGSAQQNISQVLIKSLEISVNDKVELFHLEVDHMMKKIKANYNHIRTLTALRDTLLPKLISGELRIK